MRRKFALSVLLFISLVPLILSCNNIQVSTANKPLQEQNNRPAEDMDRSVLTQAETPPSSPISIGLFMSEAPLLNVPASLMCTLKLAPGFPETENVTSQVKLPTTASLVSGNLSWSGNLEPGKPISYSSVIVFNATGHWTIEATVRHVIDVNNAWGDLDSLFLDIGVEHSQFGWPPETVKVTTAPP
jgi:hypothetical protein